MLNNNGIRCISLVTGIAMILTLAVVMSPTTQQTVSANKSSQSHELSKASQSKGGSDKAVVKQELSHDQIISLTGAFMEKLSQETNNNNKVIHYNTKNALLNEFEEITSREVASEYVNYYFIEHSDGLYIKPTETPPWFQENNAYDMIRQDNNTAVVTQENKSDLYGIYTVNIEFTWKNNQWRISDINHK
ncbi:hypothetical protein [Lentibacillus jeotgali]|uniref:hypothetical protein n=1 Tax=Lentibacillus jeotgali TaxID=558169 RepID=UPI00026278A8|nr:hypothetical protein [Lentibacillus jeotgali]